MRRPADQERLYLEAVLATCNNLPGTPARPSRSDRHLARLPASEEVLEQPPEPGYVKYRDVRLRPFASQRSALLGER